MIFTWKIEKFLKNGAFELEKFLNFPSKKFPWEIFSLNSVHPPLHVPGRARELGFQLGFRPDFFKRPAIRINPDFLTAPRDFNSTACIRSAGSVL